MGLFKLSFFIILPSIILQNLSSLSCISCFSWSNSHPFDPVIPSKAPLRHSLLDIRYSKSPSPLLRVLCVFVVNLSCPSPPIRCWTFDVECWTFPPCPLSLPIRGNSRSLAVQLLPIGIRKSSIENAIQFSLFYPLKVRYKSHMYEDKEQILDDQILREFLDNAVLNDKEKP